MSDVEYFFKCSIGGLYFLAYVPVVFCTDVGTYPAIQLVRPETVKLQSP